MITITSLVAGLAADSSAACESPSVLLSVDKKSTFATLFGAGSPPLSRRTEGELFAPQKRVNVSGCLAILAFVVQLAGCSSLSTDSIDYKNKGASKAGASLEAPPDLTQLARGERRSIPGQPVWASRHIQTVSAPDVPTAALSVEDVRVERSATQRWLVVGRPVELLWGPVHDFWQENGFLLVTDERRLGVMETDWAQSSIVLPQGIIRGTIDKVVDTARPGRQFDRFRTRFESTPGGTEIYVSYRGMEEVYASARDERAVWRVRPTDPESEAEMLRRLMFKLGATEAAPQAPASDKAANARVESGSEVPVVRLDTDFDRAWRRVGRALDRTDFTVEDRDRSRGIYFVRYVTPHPERKEPGIFAKLLGRTNAADDVPLKLRILVTSQGETSTVSVLGASGQPDATENARRIIAVLAADLR